MGKSSAPPLAGEAIRQARHGKFMTQAEVAEQVALLVRDHDIKFDRSGLSLIESGAVKRPHPKVVGALAQVLGMDADAIYETGDRAEDDDESEAAAKPAA